MASTLPRQCNISESTLNKEMQIEKYRNKEMQSLQMCWSVANDGFTDKQTSSSVNYSFSHNSTAGNKAYCYTVIKNLRKFSFLADIFPFHGNKGEGKIGLILEYPPCRRKCLWLDGGLSTRNISSFSGSLREIKYERPLFFTDNWHTGADCKIFHWIQIFCKISEPLMMI